MPLRFGPEEKKRLRSALMKRGHNLATMLSEVLAGKAPPHLAALLAARPGKRPEEVLRLALDQNEARRKMIDDDDDRFGRCDSCGVEIPLMALYDVPWADRCPAHAGDVGQQ